MKLFWWCFILSLIGFLIGASLAMAEDIDFGRLVKAVIQVESGGDTNAVSPAGAIGLMQVTPICLKEFNDEMKRSGTLQLRYGNDEIDIRYTADYFRYGNREESCIKIEKKDLTNESANRIVGTWYIHRLHDHYGCTSIETIASAYNGGITRLRNNGFDVSKMPKESRDYVVKVRREYERLK